MDYQGEIAPVNLALYCLSFTYEVSAAVYLTYFSVGEFKFGECEAWVLTFHPFPHAHKQEKQISGRQSFLSKYSSKTEYFCIDRPPN